MGKSPKLKTKICFLLTNDLACDPRVTKEVETAVLAGYEVLVLGFDAVPQKMGWPSISNKNGFKLILTSFLYNEPVNSISFGLNFDLGLHNLKIIFKEYLSWAIGQLILIKRRLFRKNPPATSKPLKPVLSSQANLPGKPPKLNLIEKIYRLYYGNIFRRHLGALRFYAKLNNFFIEEGTKFKPDIIHANDLDTLWAGYMIKKKTGAKLVYDAHEIWAMQGQVLPKIFIYDFQRKEKFLLKKIDAFITVNQSLKLQIALINQHHFNYPSDIVYNCPKYTKIALSKRDSQKIKILYQGRFALNRGLEQLTEAARFLPKKAKIYFRCLHDPAIEAKLKAIIRKYQLEKKVLFLKPVAMTKMVEAAKGFDIGVIPYIPVHIDNKFCSPNKLFEYPMSGLALAVSDLPELKRFVSENRNGVLFNPSKPQSIAGALNSLVENPKLLLQMRQNSLKAAKIFNWENEEKKLVRIYQKLFKNA